MYKFELYTKLQKETPQIYAEFAEAAKELNIKEEEKLTFGCTGAVSGVPALIRKDVEKAMDEVNRKVIGCASLQHEIRKIVKDVYGDGYDACPVTTCEAAVSVCMDQLVAPPMMTRGDRYQGRYMALLERHVHHQAGYGVPFPPKYKDIVAERGETAGEAGMAAKHLQNLATVFVPLEGADYSCHGIKYYPCALMKNTDPVKSEATIRKTAERHAAYLTGIASLGYDTPGYGYGVKDENGAPKLQTILSSVAKDYNIPYIIDNAWGIPFVGTDPRKAGCDAILYSMDKASGSPTAGLIIGKEEPMVQIRRALGMHGSRYGTTSSYGKAQFVTLDAGKEMLAGMIQALKVCRDNPKVMTKPVDDLYKIVTEEFGKIHPAIRPFFSFAKSYNSQAVEVNYEDSWKGREIGIPIFSIEDMYAGSNILQSGCLKIGIVPTIKYDANIFFSPGLGTLDENGEIIESTMRKSVRAVVILLEIISKHAGIIS